MRSTTDKCYFGSFNDRNIHLKIIFIIYFCQSTEPQFLVSVILVFFEQNIESKTPVNMYKIISHHSCIPTLAKKQEATP